MRRLSGSNMNSLHSAFQRAKLCSAPSAHATLGRSYAALTNCQLVPSEIRETEQQSIFSLLSLPRHGHGARQAPVCQAVHLAGFHSKLWQSCAALETPVWHQIFMFKRLWQAFIQLVGHQHTASVVPMPAPELQSMFGRQQARPEHASQPLPFRQSSRHHAAFAEPLESFSDDEISSELGTSAAQTGDSLDPSEGLPVQKQQHQTESQSNRNAAGHQQFTLEFADLYSKGMAESKAGQHLQAFKTLSTLIEATKGLSLGTIVHLVARAYVAKKLHKPDIAMRDLLRARALDPSDPLVASHLAELFERKAAFHQAYQLYTSAIEAVPQEAAMWNRRGCVQMKLKKYKLALQDFNQALQLQPHSAEALAGKAAAMSELGELQEALHACDLALVQRPGYHKALEQRAEILMRLGKPEQALVLLDSALQDVEGPPGSLLLRRAKVLLRLGYAPAAVEDAKAAAEAAPTSMYILRGCAGVLDRAQDLEGALRLLHIVQKLPGSPANLNAQIQRLDAAVSRRKNKGRG